MKSQFTTALAPYLKRFKLVSVALALVFLANFSWGQFVAPDGPKRHCTMLAKAAQKVDANAADKTHDCCPKRGKIPPSNPDCCKYPCYTQAATQLPVLLGDAVITVAINTLQLPHQRYRDRLVASLSPPELRPPII